MPRSSQASGSAGGLRHYDPSQLWFQVREIIHERTYLRHGIEVGEGDVVLDVGANVGVAAVFFAADCGAARVHSFEPVGPIFELLEANVAELPACVPHPYGLSSAPGDAEITFYPGAAAMSGLHADPARDRATVRAALLNLGATDEEAEDQLSGRYDDPQMHRCELRTVSSALAENSVDRVDLLKIDVEHAELEVLRGVDESDWPRIRQLVAEVHHPSRLEQIAAELRGRGFEVAAEQEPAMRGTEVRMLYARRP
jgi:31-O-methyltransferase